MTRDPATLAILLEDTRDQLQAMATLLAAVVANAGGVVEITPADVALAHGRDVKVFSGEASKVVLLSLTP